QEPRRCRSPPLLRDAYCRPRDAACSRRSPHGSAGGAHFARLAGRAEGLPDIEDESGASGSPAWSVRRMPPRVPFHPDRNLMFLAQPDSKRKNGTFRQRAGNLITSMFSMPTPSAANDDVELMLRVKAGDCVSFALLLDRHRSSVERFLYAKVRNRALAEEL